MLATHPYDTEAVASTNETHVKEALVHGQNNIA